MPYELLRKMPLFADLGESDLRQLSEGAEERRLPAGEQLFAEGSPGDSAYAILEGELEVLKSSGNREVLIAVRGPGEIIGELALLEDVPRSATVRARDDCVLLTIRKEQLERLLNTSVSASQTMFRTMLARWRSTDTALRESEKMAQLGTLAAGVTHELNNPAAAVKRGAGQLEAALADLRQAQAAVTGLALEATQQETLEMLGLRVREKARKPPEMDALVRSDREEKLEEWLESLGMENAWEVAPELVNLDYDADDLKALAACYDSQQLPVVVAWLGAVYGVHSLLSEISSGADRISSIVDALKRYSFLDRAPIQDVNIHEGLDNTLVILQHKLRQGVNVRRDYAQDLPTIEACGSDLNQVWTNIIDNAIDAMEGSGEIVIRTRKDDDTVIVEIEDSGPGIPAEVRDRIFEPFFTTKSPGKGTGLGLDISYNIVVNRHRGDIQVFSEPGRTRFEIRLPVRSGPQGASCD